MLLTRLFWLTALLSLYTLIGLAQVQYVTIQPPVDETHDPDVRIRRVELTPEYTILYMTFQHKSSGKQPQQPYKVPFPMDQPNVTSTSTIQFEPTARLFANRGDVSYKFIRAENIPVRDRLDVTSGKRVDFVAYFERLAPGVTVFDLFECNDRQGNICFNFYGVHVTNPKKPTSKPTDKPAATPPAVARPGKPGAVVPTPAAPSAVPTATAVTIYGRVKDAKNSNPVGADITLKPLAGKTTDPPENSRADSQTGDYRVVVKPAATYLLTVMAKGYFSKTDTLATGRADLLRNLTLTPIETGAKITLENIKFDLSSYVLRPQSYPELNRLAQLMRDNPRLKIRVEGHTDVIGDFDENLTLSRNRVNEVKAYLVKKGIDDSRIDTMGYGASRPITKKGSEQNRRVEIVITES